MADWTNEDIINGIRGTQAQREEALKQVFLDAALRSTVRRLASGEQQAKDVFQEALIKFDRSIRAGAFEERSHWRSYFVGIVKWHLLDDRRKKVSQSLELKPAVLGGATEHPESVLIASERRQLLKEVIAKLSGGCPQVLELYMLDYNMKEIGDQVGKSEEAVRKEAERCRKKLRELLLQSSDLIQVLNLKTPQP